MIVFNKKIDVTVNSIKHTKRNFFKTQLDFVVQSKMEAILHRIVKPHVADDHSFEILLQHCRTAPRNQVRELIGAIRDACTLHNMPPFACKSDDNLEDVLDCYTNCSIIRGYNNSTFEEDERIARLEAKWKNPKNGELCSKCNRYALVPVSAHCSRAGAAKKLSSVNICQACQ